MGPAAAMTNPHLIASRLPLGCTIGGLIAIGCAFSISGCTKVHFSSIQPHAEKSKPETTNLTPAVNERPTKIDTQRAPVRFEFTRLCMGVKAQITLYAPDESTANRAAAAAFAQIAAIEAVLSDYRIDSDVTRVTRSRGESVTVDPLLIEMLRYGKSLSIATDGRFDVTFGSLTVLWRAARRSSTLPSADTLQKARDATGFRNITFNDNTVRVHKAGLSLDFGGIAKGYASQRAVNTLKDNGVSSCLVALSGDICVGDAPPGTQGWRIGVDNLGELELSNVSISTSGGSQQYITIGPDRYEHIVDPATGLGAQPNPHRPTSVTIISNRGELADALATAAYLTSIADLPKLYERSLSLHYQTDPPIFIAAVPSDSELITTDATSHKYEALILGASSNLRWLQPIRAHNTSTK